MSHLSKKIEILINRSYHPRIPVGHLLINSLSVDINFIPKVFDDFKYLLAATCEITSFVLAIPNKSSAAQVLSEALIHRVI